MYDPRLAETTAILTNHIKLVERNLSCQNSPILHKGSKNGFGTSCERVGLATYTTNPANVVFIRPTSPNQNINYMLRSSSNLQFPFFP